MAVIISDYQSHMKIRTTQNKFRCWDLVRYAFSLLLLSLILNGCGEPSSVKNGISQNRPAAYIKTGDAVVPEVSESQLPFGQRQLIFAETVYPLTKFYCTSCHGDSAVENAALPAFAQSDIAKALEIVESKYVDYGSTQISLFVTRLENGHNCWSDCSQNAQRMELAISTLRSKVKTLTGSNTIISEPDSGTQTDIPTTNNPALPATDQPVVTQPDPVLNNPPVNSPPGTPDIGSPVTPPVDQPVIDAPVTPDIPLTESQTRFSTTLYPVLETRCASCHGDNAVAGADAFAQTDIALAFDIVVNNSLANIDNPTASPLVQRLVRDKHFCWSNCTANGSAMADAIFLMAQSETPTPPVNTTPDSPPADTGSTSSGVSVFSQTLYPLVEEYCATCHSGAIENLLDIANPEPQIAYDTIISNNLVDLTSPAESVLVNKIAVQNHSCWSDCIADASRIEGAVAQWAELLASPVNNGNNPPIAVADSYSTRVNTAFTTGNVLLNDSDPDGDVLAITDVTALTTLGGSVVNNVNGTFDYTPANGFSGTDTFSYTLTDGNGGTALGQVTINVEARNTNLPDAQNDKLFTNANTPITTSLLLNNDVDSNGGTITITKVDPVTREGGSIQLLANNEIRYTPPVGFTGSDQFSYTIANSAGFTAVGIVEVQVNSQPVAVSDAIYTYVDTPVNTFSVFWNDTDIDNDALTIASFDTSSTEAGSVTYVGNGVFTYEPLPDFQGSDSFNYIVADGRGGSAQATVFISVIEPVLRDDNRFLQALNTTAPMNVENEETARAYYRAVDPLDQRTTLNDWREVNGFNLGADAAATYINANDLGFSRRMFVRTDPITGVVSSYVENYANLRDAINRRDVIATVAMEHNVAPGTDPQDPQQPRFTSFYVFDAQNRRALGADLDGRGFKFVPGICNVCHGGRPKALVNGFYPDNGNTGGGFIPWDLDTYEFSDNTATVSRSEQEGQFKVFNQSVLNTNPKAAQVELIEGWYGGPGMPATTFNGQYVPQGWLPPAAPVEAAQLYQQVVAPFCRACHVMLGSSLQSDIDFASHEKFLSYASTIETLVFDEGTMPLALRTFDRFWELDPSVPVTLAEFLDSSHLLDGNTVLAPGRPLANAGPPSRQAALGRVSLNANGSDFAAGNAAFNFTLVERPAGSLAEINAPRSAETFFIADVPGRYVVQLVVNDGVGGTPQSPPAEVVINVSAALRGTSFVNDIVPTFEACVACHTGFDKPRFNNLSILYDNVINFVNLDDPLNSKILTKPSGDHHGGGTIAGFETPVSISFQLILRWITEGALDN